MTKYREILRLKSLGFSERNIAHSCGVSRNTVAKVVKKAAEINLSWPLDHDMTDSVYYGENVPLFRRNGYRSCSEIAVNTEVFGIIESPFVIPI